MGSYFDVEGMAEIHRKLLELGELGREIEAKAVSAGAEVVRKKISEEAPRSAKPRPKATHGTQTWRTGKHAADHITASRVKNVNGVKMVDVGISRGDNSKYYYLKFHEFGTAKMPPNPFMDRALELSKDKAQEEMADVFKEELGL